MIGNTLILSASILALLLIGPGLPNAVAVILLFVSGAVRSMELTALATLTFADVEGEQRTGANTLAAVTTQLGFSLGVALSAAVLGASASLRGSHGLDLLDFRIAFAIAGLIALPAVISSWKLPHHAGAEVSGHKRTPV